MSDYHLYLSTACRHDLHARCRRGCKFCAASCCCTCHSSIQSMEVAVTESFDNPASVGGDIDTEVAQPVETVQPDPPAVVEQPVVEPENGEDDGDPDALDTGDVAEVPEAEQVETDDPEPNEDAGDDLADVVEGEVVEITEDDESV